MNIDKISRKKITPKRSQSKPLDEVGMNTSEFEENYMVTRARSSAKKSLTKEESIEKQDKSMASDDMNHLPLKNFV